MNQKRSDMGPSEPYLLADDASSRTSVSDSSVRADSFRNATASMTLDFPLPLGPYSRATWLALPRFPSVRSISVFPKVLKFSRRILLNMILTSVKKFI